MSTGIYANHRRNQKEWILEVAEELFIQKGIEKVTLNQITKATRLTRPTLYKYFSSKEQMAEEIYKVITKGWVDRNLEEVWTFKGSGYERIERFLTIHLNHLLNNPREARFVAEFNSLYAKAWSVEETIKLIDETLGGERDQILEAIYQGQADGSLRADMEPELMMAAFFNFVSGMNNRLGEMGGKVEIEYGMDLQTIYMQVCRIFLDGLKAQPSSQ